MKKQMLVMILAIFASSCANLDKLVDQGRYNEAIRVATKKMQGDKYKKTKHVLALEEAFNKVQDEDLREAKYLETSTDGRSWDRVYSIYKKIEERQALVSPMLPLRSKEGYRASFNFIKVGPLLSNAAKEAAGYHYASAEQSLERAEQGNKDAAKNAFASLERVQRYFTNYKDVADLKLKAQYLAKTRILVMLDNQAPVMIPYEFEREILDISIRDLNSKFKEFYMEDRDNIDIYATLTITNMDVSPERETINHFHEEKRIKDGWEYLLDKRGNIRTDSLGNKLKVDKYIIAKAHVHEIVREKRANVRGKIRYEDARTNELIAKMPVQVETIFEDYAISFDGDRRALSDRCINNLKRFPEPFPSDFDMALLAADEVKDYWKSDLRRQFR